nr:IS3 family transposase [Pseudofrankia sp. DC12]
MSESWFYKWRRGDLSVRRARRRALADLVTVLFHRHAGTYGSPRITADLRERGWKVSKNTVAAVMAEQGLAARRRRRRRGLTKADRGARKPPDLVRRDFAAPDRPDRFWVGDLTEIPNDEGPLYLADILDLHSRRCVGFALGAHHDPELVSRDVLAGHGGTRKRHRAWVAAMGDRPMGIRVRDRRQRGHERVAAMVARPGL